MKRNDVEKILEAAQETFSIMIAMSKYDEAMFIGVISAMVETYAMLNNIDKIELAAMIYANLRANDYE